MIVQHNKPRSAFTLVELMVSLALVIFIMSILSAAFGAASKAFRDLKAAGDLAEKLRGVMNLLRAELAANHFEGSKKLSDPNFWGAGNPAERSNYGPPTQGFFRIEQWYDNRTPDINQQRLLVNHSASSTTPPEYTNTGASLHFTVRSQMTNQAELFAVGLSPNLISTIDANTSRRFQRLVPGAVPAPEAIFRSEWAEVAYWLTPSLGPTGAQLVADPEVATPGTPKGLWTLRRRQRLLWPYDDTGVNAAVNPEIALRTNAAGNILSPRAVATPAFRFPATVFVNNPPANDVSFAGAVTNAGVTEPGLYPANIAEDVLLNDILSFDVQVLLGKENYPIVPPSPPTPGGVFPPSLRQYYEGPRASGFLHVAHPVVQLFSQGNSVFPQPSAPAQPIPTFPEGLPAQANVTRRFVFDTWTQDKADNGYDYSFMDGDATSNPNGIRRWELSGTPATIPLFWPNRYSQAAITPNVNPGLGGSAAIPVQGPIRIQAIKITLRIYDSKTNSTRQVSMVQDM